MYVCKIDPQNNVVTLGSNEDLFTREVSHIGDFNWISGEIPSEPVRCKAKIRYRQVEQWATVTPTGENSVKILFDEPQRAITPGQSAVLYDGDVILGGGKIY
jgi:tRNA-specific 2-thiouridylase